MPDLFTYFRHLLKEHRGSISAAAAGFTAFVNVFALQSLLPVLASAFHTGNRQVGLAVSATTLAVAIAAPFAGWLVAKLTRGQLTKLSVAGLGFCGLQVAFSSDLSSLIFWRFAQGLFLPILVAGVLSFLAEDFEPQQLGRATANYVTWTIVGGFSGRWIGGMAAAAWGWRPALFLLALVNIAAGLVLLASLDRPHQRIAAKRLAQWRDFVGSFRESSTRAAYGIGFCTLFTMVGVFSFVTFRLSASPFRLGPDGLGKIFCVYLLGILVTPFVGKVLERFGLSATIRKTATLASLGLLLTLLPFLWSVVAGLALICVAGFATQASVSSHIAQLPPETKSVTSGLYLSLYYLGGCVGGALPGIAWEQSGWAGCVVLFLLVQSVVFRLSRSFQGAV